MILTSKNNNPTVAVIGSTSMVGSRFCELATANLKLIKADLHGNIEIDITNKESTDKFFKNHRFEWIILFSAFTDVDQAEKQRDDKNGACWQINVQGTANVASACLAYQRNLIFTSTDFVFDGTKGPYTEDDKPGPNLSKVSWYGISKIEAEKIASRLREFIILRISFPYRANFLNKNDFAKNILRKYRLGNLYPMFSDQKLTPTFIDDLAPAITLLIKKNQRGIFHLVSPEVTTPYEFAKNLISTFGGNPNEIKKGSIIKLLNGKNSTPRPVAGGLKVTKIIKAGFMPTNWKDGIAKIFSQSRGQLI